MIAKNKRILSVPILSGKKRMRLKDDLNLTNFVFYGVLFLSAANHLQRSFFVCRKSFTVSQLFCFKRIFRNSFHVRFSHVLNCVAHNVSMIFATSHLFSTHLSCCWRKANRVVFARNLNE